MGVGVFFCGDMARDGVGAARRPLSGAPSSGETSALWRAARGVFVENGCVLAVMRVEWMWGRAAQASRGAAGRPGSLSSEGAASGLREGCFPRGGARPAHRCTCGMRGGRGVSFERPRAPRARRGGRARAQGRFPSRGDSVRSRERVARTAPRRRDLCRAGGAGHWQALFRWLPCPAGLFGVCKLGHCRSTRSRKSAEPGA